MSPPEQRPFPRFLFTYSQGHYADPHPPAMLMVLELIASGHSLRASAGFIGIPYSNLLNWIAIDTNFAFRIDAAAARRVYTLESTTLATTDPVQAKVTLQALRRAAPEAWDDPRITPHDNPLPTRIEQEIVYPPLRDTPRLIPSPPPPKERMN